MKKYDKTEEMSETFQRAFSMSEINLRKAINLYNEELKNNPGNFAAINNRGLCKLKLAIENKEVELLESSKRDFRLAIKLANETEVKGFQIAEANLKSAEETHFDTKS